MTAESKPTSIPGIHHITAVVGDSKDNVRFYTEILGLRLIKKTVNFDDISTYHHLTTESRDDRTRYESTAGRETGAGARVIDLVEAADRAMPGGGTVHHVGFRVPDDATQAAWREELTERGLQVTQQKDRNYFQSIYFREENGILFEFTTDLPGFTVDESVQQLGASLRLPEWLEDDGEAIESRPPSLQTNPVRADGGRR